LANRNRSFFRAFLLRAARLDRETYNAGRVDLPVGVSLFANDLPAPRSWARDVYPNLFYWNELDSGGHFASLEKPELFTEELRNCFRNMRQSDHPDTIPEKE